MIHKNSDGVHRELNDTAMKNSRHLLLMDSDSGVCWSLDKGLRLSGYEVRTAESLQALLDPRQLEWADCVLMELLPEAGITLEVVCRIVEMKNAPVVICTSIDAKPGMVIECMRCGASNFLSKPFSLAEVRRALSENLNHGHTPGGMDSLKSDWPDESAASPIVGVSPAMHELRAFIKQVAQTNLNCLIRGESGVGKDVVAREIHRLSPRKEKPFVKVNCTALPEALLESELFGYEKGAFTGAMTAKPGRFSLANDGLIFLDEIGDMHPGLQAKILQVIEHKEFTPIGGTRSTKVDVQIIAATNADLEEKAASNQFRKDLFFRLNEIQIGVPPLRERKEDIPLLVRHFLKKHSKQAVSGNLKISGQEIEEMARYDWPGNVRELENTIKRWFVLGKQMPQGQMWMSNHAREAVQREDNQPASDKAKTKKPAKKVVRDLTRQEILAALEKNNWNRKKTASDLGVGYQALRRKIEKFKLTSID